MPRPPKPTRQVPGIYITRLATSLSPRSMMERLAAQSISSTTSPTSQGTSWRHCTAPPTAPYRPDRGERVPVTHGGPSRTRRQRLSASFSDPSSACSRAIWRPSGVKPEDIGAILMTHLHPDHVGGLVDGSGHAVFPNAELIVHANEHAYWSDPKVLANAADGLAKQWVQLTLAALAAYRGRTRFISNGEVPPAISAVPEPGHTPGHTGWLIAPQRGAVDLGRRRASAGHPVHLSWGWLVRRRCGQRAGEHDPPAHYGYGGNRSPACCGHASGFPELRLCRARR